MRKLVLIVRREIVERKMFVQGSLAIGVMILLIAFGPGNPPIPELWNAMSMWFAIIAAVLISLYAGSSFIASELREGRLSFYLARPVPIVSLWAGKMLAAWLLALICAILITVPVTLTGNGLILLFTSSGPAAAEIPLVAVLALFLVALGHVAGIALRARSPWLLLDFITITIASIMTVLAIRPLFMSFALGLVGTMIGVGLLLLAIFLFSAGVLGVRRGRSDLAEVHRVTSIVAAIGLMVVSLLVVGYSSHVRATTPDELRTVEILECATLECDPVFTGSAAGIGDYRPIFSSGSDATFSLPQAQMVGSDPDGNWIVWAAPTRAMDPMFDYSFRSSSKTSASLGLEEDLWRIERFAIDGDRLAYLANETLTVIDLEQDRIVRSVRVGGSSYSGGLGPDEADLDFAGDEHLLVIEHERHPLESTFHIREIALDDGKVTRSGSFSALVYWRQGDHYLSRQGSKRRVHDRGTGNVLVERDGDDVIVTGDQAVFESGTRPTTLEVTDLQGTTVRRIELEGSTDIVMGEATADGRLPVAVRKSGRFSRTEWGNSTLLLVDLESGETEEVATGLVPARLQNPRVRGPYYLENGPNGTSRLVRYDGKNEIRVIAGPSR